ncbi:MAG: amidase family protein, partial [Myxococcota bacterium]
FDVTVRYPEEVAGVPMESYIDWMKSSYYVSVTGLPAISLPFGFTDEGLPVGVQIVGRWHDDFGVMQLAWALEQSLAIAAIRPPIDERESS